MADIQSRENLRERYAAERGAAPERAPGAAPGPPEFERERERSAQFVAGGTSFEALGGLTAVVLAIIGLAGTLPGFMVAICAIVIGGALVFKGAAIGARWTRIARETAGSASGTTELGTGVTTEFLGGAAAVVLGVLALLEVGPAATMIAASVIVLGASLLLGTGMESRLTTLSGPSMYSTAQEAARMTAQAAAGAQALVGIAAVILGILAIVGTFDTLMLNLVSMLVLGSALAVSGGALAGQMVGSMRR